MSEAIGADVWVVADHFRPGRLTVGHWVNPAGDAVWLPVGTIDGVDTARMAEFWIAEELAECEDLSRLDSDGLAELWDPPSQAGSWLPPWGE